MFIHTASAFLERANTNLEDQAIILPSNVPVYTIYRDFSQLTLDNYSQILHDFQEHTWLKKKSAPAQASMSSELHRPAHPPKPFKIPKACISGALAAIPATGCLKGQRIDKVEDKEPLSFNLIIQGKDGAAKWKTVSEDSLQSVANTIMFETLNGYSIVFSGALLQSDLRRIKARDKTYRLIKVNSTSGLNVVHRPESSIIGILC